MYISTVEYGRSVRFRGIAVTLFFSVHYRDIVTMTVTVTVTAIMTAAVLNLLEHTYTHKQAPYVIAEFK
jgi:hypothetical protein